MKIKGIKLYQPVYVTNKLVSFISLENPLASGLRGDIKLTLLEGMGVLIEVEKDAVVISFNNLASIQIEPGSHKEDGESAQKEVKSPKAK
jgi:hypothetical protein